MAVSCWLHFFPILCDFDECSDTVAQKGVHVTLNKHKSRLCVFRSKSENWLIVAWGDQHTHWDGLPYLVGECVLMDQLIDINGKYWIRFKQPETRLSVFAF